MRTRSRAILNYGFAVLTVAAAFACVAVLSHVLNAAQPVSLFLCAVIFVAWFAGLGPALLATALSVLAFGYFFLLPLTLASGDLPRIVLFGVVSLFIASVSSAQSETTASLRRARDQLQGAVQDLRKSEAYLEQAQQISQTGSFGWNIASGDLVWSKESYQILEIDPTVKPTIGLVMQHVPLDDYEFVRSELDRGAQGAQYLEYEHGWLTPDGRLKQIHVRADRVNYGSGREEIVGALMDVTEARKAQKALASAQAQLAHANRIATLGEMSASIAHEVNQPLTAIVTNASAGMRWLSRENPDVSETLDAVKQIIGDAERASAVIQRIRALARRGKPEMAQLDINKLIDEVVVLVRPEAVNHRVSLRLETAPGLPPVYGDRIQLQQVIINLLINGIQAMASVTDRMRVLVVRTQQYEANTILVAVQDFGVGVDAENLNQLFSPFYTTKSDGMGMGLSISRSIIEAHGGRIWATPNDGPGMTFQFTISGKSTQRLGPNSVVATATQQ